MNDPVAEPISQLDVVEMLGTVERAMSRDVVLLAPDTPVGDAFALIQGTHATGGGLVVEAGRVIGVVTIPDLLNVRASAWCTGTLWGPGRSHAGWRVADVMERCRWVASKADPLALVVVKMDEAELDRLPVVDEGGRPVGLLTRRDVIHAVARRVRGRVKAA